MTKQRLLCGLVGLTFLLAIAGLLGQSGKPTREVMRQKLEHSQRVLEGITLEDFDLVVQQSKKLAALSQGPAWSADTTPEYAAYSELFRRNVTALTKAAEDRNLDGTTLAYLKVTLSCVECHKHMRGKKAAFLDAEQPLAIACLRSDLASRTGISTSPW